MQSGDVKVYNQRNVIDCDFSVGDNFISDDKFAALSSYEVYPEDVLVTTRGTIGRAAVLPLDAPKGILHPCLIRVQPDTAVLGSLYLCTLINDSNLLRTQIDVMSNATTIEVIYSDTMASLFVPVPPLGEQALINDFVRSEKATLDTLSAEVVRSIAVLQERRSALISAAVTGKIDVRGLVPREAVAA